MVEKKVNDFGMQTLTWSGWVLVLIVAGICISLGYFAAELSGFPQYPGYQGVLVEQPWLGAGKALLAMVGSLVVCSRLAIFLTSKKDARLGPALAMLCLVGFALRGGNMGSVMRAGDGRLLFASLAVEMAALGLLSWGCFAGRRILGGGKVKVVTERFDAVTALFQALLFTVVMNAVGRSYLLQQGIWSVFSAGAVATLLTHLVMGRTWRGAWCIPLIVGLGGYAVNAVMGKGIDIATLQSPVSGLAMASPLMYAGVGPIGIVIGEFLHGMEEKEHRAAVAAG